MNTQLNVKEMEAHYYQVNLTWSQDRKGMMCSPELNTPASENGCIEVATPPQFPKGVPGIWSPEHLFTAAVTSCFMTTFLSIAENSKLNFTSFSASSRGKLDKVEGKFRMTEILIEPYLTIPDDKDRERALRILIKTEQSCLITNSITSSVVMNPTIKVTDPSIEETQAA